MTAARAAVGGVMTGMQGPVAWALLPAALLGQVPTRETGIRVGEGVGTGLGWVWVVLLLAALLVAWFVVRGGRKRAPP